MHERWYPLTQRGYYTADLTVTDSPEWECCAADVTAYRGCTVGVHTDGTGCCVLTDADGTVLQRWNAVPDTLPLPDNAGQLYISNRHTVQPDFYLTVPAARTVRPNGLLFWKDCTAPDTPDGTPLPMGIEHALVIPRSTALDSWTLTAEITAADHTEEVFFGSRITQPRPCRHATLCSVNFADATLRLYRGSDGTSIPTEVVQSADISSIIPAGRESCHYTLRLERVDSAIRASVISGVTGESVSVFQGLIPEETPTTVAGACVAGKMFDSPQLFAAAGRPLLRRFYGAAKTRPKVMFFGDSLTQGAHNLPRDGWAQMSAAYFGDSMCCGRGSGDIWSCLNQVRSLVPVCRPKAMVVTIGGNNSVDITASLYEKFIRMAEYWGVILVLNCISACDKRPQCEGMNQHLRKLPALKCRFDLVTTQGHVPGGPQIAEYYVADMTHLNGEGNRVLYRRFISDFAWLKEL